jgi:hypothetical protein
MDFDRFLPNLDDFFKNRRDRREPNFLNTGHTHLKFPHSQVTRILARSVFLASLSDVIRLSRDENQTRMNEALYSSYCQS